MICEFSACFRPGRSADRNRKDRPIRYPTPPEIITSLPWPLITLAFEPSWNGIYAYPLRVGVCRWANPSACLEAWQTLVDPDPSWTGNIPTPVGISRSELNERNGRAQYSADGVVDSLNALVGSHCVYVDDHSSIHSIECARSLFEVSKATATFQIKRWDKLALSVDRDVLQNAKAFIEEVGFVSDHPAILATSLMHGLAFALGCRLDPEIQELAF